MCGTVYGLSWILAGIGLVIIGALGKTINIGHNRPILVKGISAVVVGIVAVIVGIALINMSID
jgi:hypothetical protein